MAMMAPDAQMPTNIRAFEALSYAAIFVRLITVLATFPLVEFAVPLPALLLNTLVIWLAARRRKNWARWTLVVWFVVATPVSYLVFPFEFNVWEMALVVATLMEGIAIALVLTRSAQTWFVAGRPADAMS